MRKIAAIVAMTKDRVIGVKNKIPWHYPEDFKRFKRVTLGSIVIMGRKTWESIGSKALPERRNIVISRSELKDVEHYHSIQDALEACENSTMPIWFIGGGVIYEAALEFCNHLDITLVPNEIDPENAILFPPIDASEWIATPPTALEEDPRLSVQTYTRRT